VKSLFSLFSLQLEASLSKLSSQESAIQNWMMKENIEKCKFVIKFQIILAKNQVIRTIHASVVSL